MPAPTWVRVWPPWQRVLHAVLGASVLVALVTHEGGRMHELAGYAALAAALARIALGLVGPRPARFSTFVLAPRATWAYARRVVQARAERHLNHNPLGAWMVVVLLVAAALAGASGALYVTDAYWGEAWLVAAHAAFAWPLAGLVPLHLAGVWHASRAHCENLAAAMWHGRKPVRPDDGP